MMMYITAKGLREEFEKDLKWLQDNCKHEDTVLWAVGPEAHPVSLCKVCDKVIKIKDIIDNASNS